MTGIQKIIKYVALAFAIFLIITIVSSILSVLFGLTKFTKHIRNSRDNNNNTNSNEMITTTFENNNNAVVDLDSAKNFENNDITRLDIDIKYANLIIKTGEQLRVDTNNNDINIKQDNERLEIKEDDGNWFRVNGDNEDITLYIPENMEFDKIKITAGAGKIDIEKLDTKELSYELGAGESTIKNLIVGEKANFEGGAGKMNIASGEINNLKLNMGVGKTDITAKIVGDSKINAGIGSLNININGNKEDYRTKVSKGLGAIKIDGKDVEDNETYGDGENSIKIDGGIGKIDIDFK